MTTYRWFPSDGSREVKVVSGRGFLSGSGFVAPMYTDEALTTLATGLLDADSAALDAAAGIVVDAYSQLPLFQVPDSLPDTLWTSVNGGPAWPVYARVDDRLDDLDTRLTAVEPGGGGAALQVAENLADLDDAATARASLGLGSAAVAASSAFDAAGAASSAVAAIPADGAAGTASLRTLGTGAGQAAVGLHASQHASGGGDELALGALVDYPATSDVRYQALDSDLTAIAALTASGSAVIQESGGAWEARTPAQLASTLPGAPLVARRLLAGAAVLGSDAAVSSLSPTIALGTAGASPTISSAVRVAPKRASSTVIDTANDPHFEFVGAIPGRVLVSSGDMFYADYLTGGSSQNARNHPRIKFVYTGQAFEAYFRARTTTILYRLWVDGLPLTATMQSLAVSTSQRYYLKVDFGSSGTRQIEFEVDDPEFGGVAIEPTASITRPQAAPLLLAGFGDSHTRGANGVGWNDVWVRRAANILHAEWANLAIGGSGYLNDNGTTGANYRNRLTTDITPVVPDILVFEGSWNDTSATEPNLAAEAAYCFGVLKAALPNTLLIAAGPWVVGHTLNATLDSHDATLVAQAQAAGWHGYISYRDPLKLKGSTSAWAGSTAYAVGDARTQNGFVQTCVTAHTSSGSFDQTKWRSTAIVTGTGKTGATTGDGSADVIVSNDGVHNTLLGHQVKARHVAAEIARIARSIAAGNAWAA